MSQWSQMNQSMMQLQRQNRQHSAVSVYSYYLETLGDREDQEANAEPKGWKKCCRKSCCRRRKCCGCFRRSRKVSDGSAAKSANSAESSDEYSSEEEISPQTFCFGLFRRGGKRKSIRIKEEEEWQEDMGKVEHVTSGFKDWLAHTYRKDKKAPARVRKARMKARRNWMKSTVAPSTIRDRGSIISLKAIDESKLPVINELMHDIASWEFNTFELDEQTTHQSLSFVVREVFRMQHFMEKFRIKNSTLKNLLKALEAGYSMHGNPYHNERHAADVTQTVHAILSSHPAISHKFTDLEIFALVFAAVIHDLAHPGTTNNFHINAQTNLALLYNDRNVLENHHVASAFQILKHQSCNILENFSREEYKEFRELVIELVLGTDMVNHFQHIKIIRNILKQRDWNGTSHKTISTTLALILHAADISNPAKPWVQHKACTELVYAEYLAQGIQETELKIPVSPLCDPKDQNAATQITFIEVIVQPTFQVLGDLFDLILSSELPEESSTPSIKPRISTETTVQLLPQARPGRLSIFASTAAALRGTRNSKVGEENYIRPWMTHLTINIAEWRKIHDAETQAQKKVRMSVGSPEKRNSKLPNFSIQLKKKSSSKANISGLEL